jgi:hypothetical protein
MMFGEYYPPVYANHIVRGTLEDHLSRMISESQLLHLNASAL